MGDDKKNINNFFHDISNSLFVLKSIFNENKNEDADNKNLNSVGGIVKGEDFLESEEVISRIEKLISVYKTSLGLDSGDFNNDKKIAFSNILNRIIKISEKNNKIKISSNVKEDIFVKGNEDFIEFLIFEIIDKYLKTIGGTASLKDDGNFIEFKVKIKK